MVNCFPYAGGAQIIRGMPQNKWIAEFIDDSGAKHIADVYFAPFAKPRIKFR
jgi:hypothetical protein